MHDFRDFDDYRVTAWVSDGLMVRIVEIADSVVSSVKKTSSYAIAATVLSAIATFSMPANVVAAAAPVASLTSPSASVSTNPSLSAAVPGDIDTVDSDVLRMSLEIDKQLELLLNFSAITLDGDTLSLANEAVVALNARDGEYVQNWAKGMFDDCI